MITDPARLEDTLWRERSHIWAQDHPGTQVSMEMLTRYFQDDHQAGGIPCLLYTSDAADDM
eukprot:2072362-Prorocentrum_lima.AAC.1